MFFQLLSCFTLRQFFYIQFLYWQRPQPFAQTWPVVLVTAVPLATSLSSSTLNCLRMEDSFFPLFWVSCSTLGNIKEVRWDRKKFLNFTTKTSVKSTYFKFFKVIKISTCIILAAYISSRSLVFGLSVVKVTFRVSNVN